MSTTPGHLKEFRVDRVETHSFAVYDVRRRQEPVLLLQPLSLWRPEFDVIEVDRFTWRSVVREELLAEGVDLWLFGIGKLTQELTARAEADHGPAMYAVEPWQAFYGGERFPGEVRRVQVKASSGIVSLHRVTVELGRMWVCQTGRPGSPWIPE